MRKSLSDACEIFTINFLSMKKPLYFCTYWLIYNKKVKSLPDSQRGTDCTPWRIRSEGRCGREDSVEQNRNPAHKQVQVWTGLVHRCRSAGSGPGARLRGPRSTSHPRPLPMTPVRDGA